MVERACLSTEALGKTACFSPLVEQRQRPKWPLPTLPVFSLLLFLFILFQVQTSTFLNAVVSYIEVRVAVGDRENRAGVGPLAAAHARAAGRGGGALRAPGTRN